MGVTLALCAFLIPILVAVSHNYPHSKAVRGVRLVLVVLGFALSLAGLAGLGLAGWILLQSPRSHGNATGCFLLALVVAAASVVSIFIGKTLAARSSGSPGKKTPPTIRSFGWSALNDAVTDRRHHEVAPHLRPEALRKLDANRVAQQPETRSGPSAG